MRSSPGFPDGTGDATFAWEALLAAGVRHGIEETTGETEERLLKVAADIIKRAENRKPVRRRSAPNLALYLG